jgi:hypothetical protein
VKLRFNILDAVYNNVSPSFCAPATQADYNSISGNITVNGVSVIDFTDLSTGAFIHAPFPITANGVDILGITLENILYVALEIDIPNLWDSAEVTITLDKPNYKQLVRTFTVFGYDVGQNPNIAATSINPDMYLVMIPETYGVTAATTGAIFQPPLTGSWSTATGTENITLTADFPGILGNIINVAAGDGVTPLTTLVANWNAANPANTVTLTETDGTGYTPGVGEVFTLTGGSSALIIEELAYANFVGWRKPFTNDLYLTANYSQIGDTVSYFNSTDTLANTSTAVLFCYSGDAISYTSNITEGSACGGVTIVDTCTFGPKDYDSLNLIPAFSCGVTCDSCCDDECLVNIGTNYAQFVLDVAAITPLNNSDVSIVSTESVTLKATVYNGCGAFVSSDSIVISLNPLPSLSGSQVPITFPEKGDYAVSCEISSDAFKCSHTEIFKGCSFYNLVKNDCGKHTITNLASVDLELDVETLDKDGNWVLYISNEIIAPCDSYEILTPEDGVYRVTPKVFALTEANIIVQDCNMKACFIEFTKQRVCNPKADCACGGECGGLCNKIPNDVYDFNAFSILVYNYFALLNELYVKNFIYTIFSPSDIEKLFTIKQYLERIKEYCGECSNETVDTNTGDCGCS